MDFEKAMHNAAQQVWLTIHVKGCYFRFGQSGKKIQCLGLTKDYKKQNSDECNFIKLIFVCYF